MKTFLFRAFKGKSPDGRAGIFMYGKNPDHETPTEIINRFLNGEILELVGSGMSIACFLPEDKLEEWQKICKENFWLQEGKKSNWFEIDLQKIASQYSEAS